MSRRPQPPPQPRPPAVADAHRPLTRSEAEDLHRDISLKLALLIRFTAAAGAEHPGGRDDELESDAWFAMEMILCEARAGFERLYEAVTATLTIGGVR